MSEYPNTRTMAPVMQPVNQAGTDLDSFISGLHQVVLGQKADISVVHEILSAAERFQRLKMEAQQAEQAREARLAEVAFYQAKRQARAKMVPVLKGDQGQNWRYAKYERIAEMADPILDEFGFDVSYLPRESVKEGYGALTIVIVNGAHIERVVTPELQLDVTGPRGTATKTPVQAFGSTMSYLKRYLFILFFNIPLFDEHDDDGHGQQGKTKDTQTKDTPRDRVNETIDKMEQEREKYKADFLTSLDAELAKCGTRKALEILRQDAWLKDHYRLGDDELKQTILDKMNARKAELMMVKPEPKPDLPSDIPSDTAKPAAPEEPVETPDVLVRAVEVPSQRNGQPDWGQYRQIMVAMIGAAGPEGIIGWLDAQRETIEVSPPVTRIQIIGAIHNRLTHFAMPTPAWVVEATRASE